MESWTSAVYYWDTRDYDSFAREYGGAQDSLNTKGDAFGRLVRRYSLSISFFEPRKLDLQIIYYALAGQREDGMRKRFAMLVEQVTPTASHARLIYNVDVFKDVIDVMEPRTGGFTPLGGSALGKAMLLSL
jgi:hypothetical protein